MFEVVGAFLGAESLQEFSDAFPCCFDGSFVRLCDECLELGEHHLDGIEVGTVWRQEEEVWTDIPDHISGQFSFADSQIVENNNIADSQGWHQALLDPCGKGDAIDGTINGRRGNDAVAVQPARKVSVFQ